MMRQHTITNVKGRTLANRLPGPLMTRFFRDPAQCEAFVHTFIPDVCLGNDAPFKVWCAGCSTGEEAYSIAMMCASHFHQSVRWHIHCTDVDTKAIQHASTGIYSAKEVGEVPTLYARFLAAVAPGKWTVLPDISEHMDFSTEDILCNHEDDEQKYHCVFIRNVLPYMTDTEKCAALQRIWAAVLPGGGLFVGKSEDITQYMGFMPGISERRAGDSSYYFKG